MTHPPVPQESDGEAVLFAARALWQFVQEGCFFDDLPMGELDSPERELWVKSWVAREAVRACPAISAAEEEHP